MSECSKGPCISNDNAYRDLRAKFKMQERKLKAAETSLLDLPALREDAAIIDWLSKNHVSITYYAGPSGVVQITWFVKHTPRAPCPSCKYQKERGVYPTFRGKDLREAVKKAMAREPEPEEEIFPS